MIEITNLTKAYKVSNRERGISGAIKGLFKPTYKNITAVDNISFHVNKGEIVGFIGANGAGKSTTIKMMSGILTPTSGKVVTNGFIPYEERKNNAFHIGAVFGQRSQLQWDIALEESLRFQKYIYNIDDDVFEERLEKFIKLLELEDLLRKPVRQMSLGQKMRSELACAFLHNPKIVYLDEPTIGLDVRIKEIIRKFIIDIVKMEQTTVILTTHDMQDIEQLATRIIIIDEGKLIFNGNKQELSKNYGNIKQIDVYTNNKEVFVSQSLQNCCKTCLINDYNIKIKFSTTAISVKDVVSEILQKNDVNDFNINDMQLEDIVIDLYSKEDC